MFKPKACLFDLDGLLLNTEPLHGEAWSKTAEKLGKKLTNNQLNLLKGRRRIECAKQIDQWLEDSVSEETVLKIHKPIIESIIGQSQAMPGAEELVRWCKNNALPMALVSSSTSESVLLKTANHPWLNLINTRVLGDEESLKAGKPSPFPFLLAAKKLNVDPKKCWVLEDSIAGKESALAAGCQVFVLKPDSATIDPLDSSDLISNPININQLEIVLRTLETLFSP